VSCIFRTAAESGALLIMFTCSFYDHDLYLLMMMMMMTVFSPRASPVDDTYFYFFYFFLSVTEQGRGI